MTNNEVMKSIRYTLNMNNEEVQEMIQSVGRDISNSDLVNIFKRDDEEGYLACSAEILHAFLDGLILKRRGPKEDGAPSHHFTGTINNNIILRKLRIAFAFRDTDMLAVLRSANFTMTKTELSALFRNKRHIHYVKCGDQLLRYFLRGLALRFRDNK